MNRCSITLLITLTKKQMDFDDIQMTNSFKFCDNSMSQNGLSSSPSKSPSFQLKYTCYSCGGDPLASLNCSVCQGRSKIDDNNPLADLLSTYLKVKVNGREINQKNKKSVSNSLKRIQQRCEQAKEEEYSEETPITCQICDKYCFKRQIKFENICLECSSKKITYSKREIRYTRTIKQEKFLEDSGEIQSSFKRGILKDSLNSSAQFSNFASDSKKSYELDKKFLNFSPTKSNGTVSPEKSDRTSRVQIICDESDPQIDTPFMLDINRVNESEGQNLFQSDYRHDIDEQCVNSSVKLSDIQQTKSWQQKKDNTYFIDYFCDYCSNTPRNFRYHCLQCQDYDLCRECYEKRNQIHDHQDFEQICKAKLESKKQSMANSIRTTLLKSLTNNRSRR